MLFLETTTLGIRRSITERHILERKIETVNTKFGPISVKIGRMNGKATNVAVEYENAKALAEKEQVPLKYIYSLANAAATTHHDLQSYQQNYRNSTKKTSSKKTEVKKTSSRKKSAEAEDADDIYRLRMSTLEQKMRDTLLQSLNASK